MTELELEARQYNCRKCEIGIVNDKHTDEKQAKEKLGMQKLTNKQTVYITLPKKDYVEPATEEVIKETEKNWFEKFIDKIFNR